MEKPTPALLRTLRFRSPLELFLGGDYCCSDDLFIDRIKEL
jgi:hypothetical protein